MAFDNSLDKTIKEEVIEFENTKIIVSIMCYNDGQQKVQISRKNTKDDKETFAKLGRLTKEEVASVIKALGNLFPEMQ